MAALYCQKAQKPSRRKGLSFLRSEILSQEKNKTVIHVEIDAEEFEREVANAVRELSKSANIKGFRKGHVPRRVLEMVVGKKAIHTEALEALVPKTVDTLIEEYELVLLERPQISFTQVEEGKPLVMDMTFEVRPEVTLADPRNLVVEKPVFTFTDEDIDKAVEAFRKEHASLVPVEGRGAGESDTVKVHYHAVLAGEEVPFAEEDAHIYLLSPELRREIRNALLGTEPGANVSVTVHMEDDYKDKRFAGKDVTYRFNVLEVQEEKLPELDAERISEWTQGKASSLEELRSLLKDRMVKEMEYRSAEAVKNDAFAKFVEASSIELLPETLVSREETSLREKEKNYLEQQLSTTLEAFLEQSGQSMEAYETELRERAEKNVRNRLILEAYADKVEIEVSNEDVEREMRLLAFRGKVPLKKVYELYGKNQQALAALVHSVRMEKALAHLASCVTVKEIPAGGDETRAKSEQSAEGSAAE